MACNNDNVGPQKEMNLISEADIKVEDVDIKVEVDDWPWAWIDDLEPNPQQMPRVPEVQACPAQMNPPQLNPHLMHEPHIELSEPTVDLRLDYVVCSCLVKNSIFTRSKARKHKEMCYEIWN